MPKYVRAGSENQHLEQREKLRKVHEKTEQLEREKKDAGEVLLLDNTHVCFEHSAYVDRQV
ncbi:hypothetical protein BC567DRAFT_261008 [Phyllosticta citribraziliensis]